MLLSWVIFMAKVRPSYLTKSLAFFCGINHDVRSTCMLVHASRCRSTSKDIDYVLTSVEFNHHKVCTDAGEDGQVPRRQLQSYSPAFASPRLIQQQAPGMMLITSGDRGQDQLFSVICSCEIVRSVLRIRAPPKDSLLYPLMAASGLEVGRDALVHCSHALSK